VDEGFGVDDDDDKLGELVLKGKVMFDLNKFALVPAPVLLSSSSTGLSGRIRGRFDSSREGTPLPSRSLKSFNAFCLNKNIYTM
jgi:hypothetical protein